MVGAGGESSIQSIPSSAITLEKLSPVTIFDENFINVIEKNGSNGFDLRLLHDGGKPASQDIMAKAYGSAVPPFTQTNLDAQIAQLKKDFDDGAFNEGGQVLIYIDTHGAQPKTPDGLHAVAGSEGAIDLSGLEELKAKFAGKVKLAIVDSSCYSGGTIKLADDSTCVITAAQKDQVGYIDFSRALSANLGKGVNLESAFRTARLLAQGPGLPQISGESGEEAQKIVSQIRRFLEVPSDEFEIRTGILPGKGFGLCRCSPLQAAPIEGLLKSVAELYEFGSFSMKPNQEILEGETDPEIKVAVRNLLRAIEGYRRTYADLRGLQRMLDAEIDAPHSFDFSSPTMKRNLSTGWMQLVPDNAGSIRQLRATLAKKNLSASDRSLYDELLQNALVQKEARQALLKSNSEFRKLVAADARIVSSGRDFRSQAELVAQQERSLYERVYVKASARSRKSNPCRDFIL